MTIRGAIGCERVPGEELAAFPIAATAPTRLTPEKSGGRIFFGDEKLSLAFLMRCRIEQQALRCWSEWSALMHAEPV